MYADKIALIESNLDSIQAGVTTLNTLMKPEGGIHGKHSILKAMKVFIDGFDGCLGRMKDNYDKYNQEMIESGNNMVNSINQDYQMITNNIKNIENELNQYKKDTETISKPIHEYLKRNHKTPRLYFYDSNTSYEFDVELMKKYPDSYFWEVYEDPKMWDDNGDIYIDHSSENYEYILKYMKNDENLVEDLKKIDSKRRNTFVRDLEFLRLPVKSEYMNELCFDDDKKKMEAWKENRVIMVNGKDVPSLNIYLKKNGLFDSLFNKNTIENVKYDKENNVMYVNMNLKYNDFIVDYCKTGEINKELIRKENNGNSFDEFVNEFKKIGIEFDENKKHEIMKCFKSVLFKDSIILESYQYDIKLQEWLALPYQWKLIYRASEHGFTASSFHQCCDDKGPTIIFIKSTKGCMFGGYTTQSWRFSSSNGESKDDSKAFIFTLNNPHNIPPTKLNKRKESKYAIYCNTNCGPIFGNGSDIYIRDNCNKTNNSYTANDGTHGYECDSQYKKSLFVCTNEIENANKFTVSDYEVYTIDN